MRHYPLRQKAVLSLELVVIGLLLRAIVMARTPSISVAVVQTTAGSLVLIVYVLCELYNYLFNYLSIYITFYITFSAVAVRLPN